MAYILRGGGGHITGVVGSQETCVAGEHTVHVTGVVGSQETCVGGEHTLHGLITLSPPPSYSIVYQENMLLPTAYCLGVLAIRTHKVFECTVKK